jgi:hypothetical protein
MPEFKTTATDTLVRVDRESQSVSQSSPGIWLANSMRVPRYRKELSHFIIINSLKGCPRKLELEGMIIYALQMLVATFTILACHDQNKSERKKK